MKIGMMNDPAMDPVQEILWAGAHGFDFIDLTVEGPAADATSLNVSALRDALQSTGLGIVGHTAWYLPFGSPVPQLRTGAIEAVRATFEPLAALDDGRIVAARQGRLLATAFHPELTDDTRFHELFLDM